MPSSFTCWQSTFYKQKRLVWSDGHFDQRRGVAIPFFDATNFQNTAQILKTLNYLNERIILDQMVV